MIDQSYAVRVVQVSFRTLSTIAMLQSSSNMAEIAKALKLGEPYCKQRSAPDGLRSKHLSKLAWTPAHDMIASLKEEQDTYLPECQTVDLRCYNYMRCWQTCFRSLAQSQLLWKLDGWSTVQDHQAFASSRRNDHDWQNHKYSCSPCLKN